MQILGIPGAWKLQLPLSCLRLKVFSPFSPTLPSRAKDALAHGIGQTLSETSMRASHIYYKPSVPAILQVQKQPQGETGKPFGPQPLFVPTSDAHIFSPQEALFSGRTPLPSLWRKDLGFRQQEGRVRLWHLLQTLS